jgi:hypothetical protein
MVPRAISSSLLSALMLATMLWGGCISCPRFFMFPSTKKDCCNAGRCDNSKPQKSAPGKECKRMPLEPAGSAQVDAELPVAVTASIDVVEPPAARPPAVNGILLVEHSPPDLQVLNATFLI